MFEIKKLHQALEKYESLGIEILNYLNNNPEVSGHEKKSCVYLVNLLKKYGYEVKSPCKRIKHSFLASKSTKQTKPKIAILCEYDAMENIGHGCGHSASSAASIISALALEESFEDFPFQIDLIGTPNEEQSGGKILMLQKGIFTDYEFAIVAQMGTSNQPYFRTLASSDLIVNFYGKEAHASTNPWEGINALNGVQLFFHVIDMMRQHMELGDNVQGIIVNGGEIPNLIPDKATAYVYLRSHTYQNLLKLQERVKEWIKGCSIATENSYDTAQLNPLYAEMFIGDTAKEIVCECMNELDMTCRESTTPSGSSDVGSLDISLPVFQPVISIGNTSVPLYSKEFAKLIQGSCGIEGMKSGANIITHIILKLAQNPEKLTKLKAEHALYRH